MAARAPRPEDLYDLRVPTDAAISPDGRWVAFSVLAVAPGKDGYRTSLWLAPTDASAPARQLTLGARTDAMPRWSPDGRVIAFLSDRGAVLQAGGAGSRPGPAEAPKDGAVQAWLLPVGDGGEARQLTDLPKNVEGLDWAPDGTRLVVVSGASSTKPDPQPERSPGDPPAPDTRLIDALRYQFNGRGFVHDAFSRLWLVDVDSGDAELLTRGDHHDTDPRWSPDGTRIAFVSDRHRDPDLTWRSDVYMVGLEDRRVTPLTSGGGRQAFGAPAWFPDSAWVAVIGSREWTKGIVPQSSVWRFRVADGEAEHLTDGADLEAASAMNSDLFGGGPPAVAVTADGRWVVFSAAIEGSLELWRVGVEDGRVERLTNDRHYLGRVSLAALPRGGSRVAAVRASATEAPDVVIGDLPAGRLGSTPVDLSRISDLMGEAWSDVRLVEPQERWHEVDGRRIQGWFLESPKSTKRRPAPVVAQIHGGPATLYGWSPMWEWQVLAANGISVYACNPRGSQGYGQDFVSANVGDWGDGPMRDVMGGLDALVADGLVDADRMGVTGGSYGGYLTSWIIGHTDRFRAAVTCRSVNDMTSQMLSGDIGGPTFGEYAYAVLPWEDWDLYRRHSPLTYAEHMDTPLLIQHSERDLRTTITQAEELFAVLRSLRRTVRLMRVPEETHELTRSGTPFRRVDNLRLIDEWFRHFLIEGKTRLPKIDPKRG
ncbi:MAG TPA: S9 family peptidase [Candidatus Angelobacter sp.]|nr:S9 family peptidase [Candidatus Angelobacter sp.]